MFEGKNNDFFKSFEFRPTLTEKYFEGEPLEIGNDSQLVLGDIVVEDVYRVDHEQQTPTIFSLEGVLKFDEPWEKKTHSVEGIIYDEDEQIFKTWYRIRDLYNSEEGPDWEKNVELGNVPGALCYAESKDMINWVKPKFTHCPVGPYKESNICFHGEGDGGAIVGRVFRNADRTDKEKKYLCVYLEGAKALRVAYSPDGRVWKDIPGVNPIFPVGFDTYVHVIYNAEKKKYLLYMRPAVFAKHESRPAEPVYIGLNYRRRITVSESSDLIHWSTPRIVQRVSDIADMDQCDHQNTFIVGSHVLGRLNRFKVRVIEDATNQKHRPWWTYGPDPYHMKYLDRDEPMDNCLNPDGTPSNVIPFIGGYPMYANDRTYFTLGSRTIDEKTGKPVRGMTYAYFGENRFVARVADEYGGWLLTREFFMRGNELEINCEICEGGSITAEILYANGGRVRGGQFVRGYRIEDFDTITESGVHNVLKWNGTSDLERFRDEPIFIRFNLINAKLYSFRVNDKK